MNEIFDENKENQVENDNEKNISKKVKRAYKLGLITGIIWGIAIIFVFYIGANVAASKLNEKDDSSEKSISSGSSKTSSKSSSSAVQNKISVLEQYIKKYYYEEVDEEQLNDGIYKGLLKSLDDKYSEYYTKDEFKSMNESSDGSYTGVGVAINQDPDTLEVTITKIYPNSPAEESGMEVGDKIIKIDGEDITSLTSDLLVPMVRGKEGTDITITVVRNDEEIEFTMQRAVVDIQVVTYEMFEGKVGYIVLDQFTDSAVDQFEEALTDLNSQGMEKLIVDVRDNPGGLLTSVRSILSMFLPKGELILYSMTKEGDKEEYYSQSGKIVDDNIPIVILMNGNSASAAEVFAGAMRCYNRAELVGVTSFGKGIMQSTFKLTDGTGLKLTIGKYYLPDDSNIHGTGLTPDYEAKLPEDITNIWKLEHKDDPQIQKALEVLVNK